MCISLKHTFLYYYKGMHVFNRNAVLLTKGNDFGPLPIIMYFLNNFPKLLLLR